MCELVLISLTFQLLLLTNEHVHWIRRVVSINDVAGLVLLLSADDDIVLLIKKHLFVNSIFALLRHFSRLQFFTLYMHLLFYVLSYVCPFSRRELTPLRTEFKN